MLKFRRFPKLFTCAFAKPSKLETLIAEKELKAKALLNPKLGKIGFSCCQD